MKSPQEYLHRKLMPAMFGDEVAVQFHAFLKVILLSTTRGYDECPGHCSMQCHKYLYVLSVG